MAQHATPALAWVESPLQLIGAAEWAAACGTRVDVAGRLTPQLPETGEELQRRRAAFGVVEPYLGIPWRRLAAHSHWLIGDGFSGQFRLAVTLLRPRRITFLDDGAGALAFADSLVGARPYARPGVAERGLTTRLAPLALESIQRRAFRGGIDVFSAFDLGDERVARLAGRGIDAVRHRFEWLRGTGANERLWRRIGGRRILLGSARPVDGRMALPAYLEWVAGEAVQSPVVYLPHRRETPEQLSAVAAIPGVVVEEFDLPVELVLANAPEPVEVLTLTSSTATTLPLLLADTGGRLRIRGDGDETGRVRTPRGLSKAVVS